MKPKQGQRVRARDMDGVGFVTAIADGRVYCTFPPLVKGQGARDFVCTVVDAECGDVLTDAPRPETFLFMLQPGDRFSWWDWDAAELREMVVTDFKVSGEGDFVWACDVDDGKLLVLRADRMVDVIAP